MPKAILHTTTRVARRLTSDEAPVLATDETAQDVPDSFDLAGGPWKVAVDGTKSVPTQQEIDDSDVDETRVATLRAQFLQNYMQNLTNIEDATTAAQMLPELRAWATKQKKLMRGIFR